MRLTAVFLLCVLVPAALALRVAPRKNMNPKWRRMKGPTKPESKTIWIVAFARSMSSTVMRLFISDKKAPETFSLFEPCDGRDVRTHQSAGECMKHITLDCDFSDFRRLFFWSNKKDRLSTHGKFSAKTAEQDCNAASLRVYKTILIHNISADVLPLLEANPQLEVVLLQRDPRAVYASQLLTFRMHPEPRGIDSMCGSMSEWLDIKHPRIHKLEFRDIVSDARTAFQQLFEDMRLSFEGSHADFLHEHLDNPHCHENMYGSCRRDSAQHTNLWTRTLPDEAKQMFQENPVCQTLIHRKGYDSDEIQKQIQPNEAYVERYRRQFQVAEVRNGILQN